MIAALTSLLESATPEQQAVLNNVISGLQTQQQAVNSGITQAKASDPEQVRLLQDYKIYKEEPAR